MAKLNLKPAQAPVQLPTEPNDPSDDISDYTMLLYGAKKIGKTSLAAQFPDALFLATEPGTKSLRVYSMNVLDWKTLEGAVAALKKDRKFKTVVVDTIDLVYDMAFKDVCKRKMIAHPQDENDFGKTWGEIRQQFRGIINQLMTLNKGIIFLSHDTEKEITDREGDKIDRTQPTIPKQGLEEVEGLVDFVGHYGYFGDRRVLRIDGKEELVAGCRLEEHFIRKGGKPRTDGDRIKSVPMGNTAQEAYGNLIAAFNNQQSVTDVTIPTAPSNSAKRLVIKKP